ncbi:caspase family protein [Paraburkholderia strydomiana]|uniref:caspase family protein n=1 Tax=Paraburkholderia strydomiana TaxID=1245417 RepID=UPI0038B6C46B
MKRKLGSLGRICSSIRQFGSAIPISISFGVALILSASLVFADEVERYALLIGIDRYAQPITPAGRFVALKGPPNDVALIRKLLVEKYGFKNDSEHIVTLLGQQATHSAIEMTFKRHLIEQAKKHPGAIIAFYFSGHGSQANRVTPGDTIWHDTLVAYDSRANGGTDIVDNEIVGWFEQLRQFTPNSTFILDSCHSGSAIRDIGTLVRRQLLPNPMQSVAEGGTSRTVPSSGTGDRTLSRRQQFTLLSASLADESSYEDQLQTATGKKYHGYFTYYLDQTLRLRPSSTAEQAVRTTAFALASLSPHPPSQHPQAVGDLERVLFGGPENRDDPYIPILSPPSARAFEIGAGEINGLKPGAFLAVYAPNAKKLTGDADKIANAKVTKVDATTSTAELSEKPRQTFTQQAKVTIVTPYFGFEPLRIRTTALLHQETTSDDTSLLNEFAAALDKNMLVTAAPIDGRYDLAVRRGCVNQQRQLVYASDLGNPSGASCAGKAYYLTEASGDRPLFDFFALADNPRAARELADRAVRRAKQLNILGLRNEQSPMNRKVRITLIKVLLKADPAGGLPSIHQIGTTEGSSAIVWRVGDAFQVKIENNSDKDIYAAAIMLGSSGAIELISTDPHGYLLHAHSSMVLPVPRQVGPPLGIETYKVMATTSPSVDYRSLEQSSGSRGVDTSPLEWLLAQTTNTTTRDSSALSGVGISDWVTDSFQIKIDTRK